MNGLVRGFCSRCGISIAGVLLAHCMKSKALFVCSLVHGSIKDFQKFDILCFLYQIFHEIVHQREHGVLHQFREVKSRTIQIGK